MTASYSEPLICQSERKAATAILFINIKPETWDESFDTLTEINKALIWPWSE